MKHNKYAQFPEIVTRQAQDVGNRADAQELERQAIELAHEELNAIVGGRKEHWTDYVPPWYWHDPI